MKKYEYVSYKLPGILDDKSEKHRQIIDKYAELGYRYVGYIPTNISTYGRVVDVDLIFEIDY